MRNLTETLLSAQKQASHTPFLKLEAWNKIAGAISLSWTRLYNGSEAEYFHAVTMPGDGSLIRARITPVADSRKLYWQRVAQPAPGSDFSQWNYSNQYDAVIVAAASLGAEVSIFWIKADRRIQRLKSTDYGVTWSSPEFIDFSPSVYNNGITAAYKPNGDIALFFTSQTTLYIKKYINGQWQALTPWDKTTGDLSSVATVYDGDWNLFVTGQDPDDNFKLWSLVYGDGGDVAAGTWSQLKEFDQAPSGGSFEYHRASLDKPDVFRCFYVEKFTGTEAYYRPFWSHPVVNASFTDNLWREPVPFNLSTEYGLAIAHYGDYCWLSTANGVWRAPLAGQSLELTSAVLSLRQEAKRGNGALTVELSNDDGRFSALPPPLAIGCQLNLSPGYTTPQGNEVSPRQSFMLEAYEHTNSGGKAALILHATDGWSFIDYWRARHQFRWNKSTDEMSVKDILAFILARAGLKLEVLSQSSVITGYYPDFTISPDTRGATVIERLLSFVPDVLFIEGSNAYLLNPLAEDTSIYSYATPQGEAATTHPIREGRYRVGAWQLNRVQVEGYDSSSDTIIITDSFDWNEIDRVYDRLKQLEDRNIGSVAQAQALGEAHLRKAGIESADGLIRIPVNCGQQLYDVIEITDSRAGLDAQKKRVLGLILLYNPGSGHYQQRLLLGAV